MNRHVRFALVLLPVAFMLLATGCSKKEEAPPPASKPAPSPSVNMQEGKWEITTTFEMPGMPADVMKPQTFTTCLSQKDYVPADKDQKDCTMQDVKIDGNTVTWSMACKDSSGKGRVTYAGNTFDGFIETIMREGAKEMNAKMSMKGRHIGPCTK
jgi:hypothetical protein